MQMVIDFLSLFEANVKIILCKANILLIVTHCDIIHRSRNG